MIALVCVSYTAHSDIQAEDSCSSSYSMKCPLVVDTDQFGDIAVEK